MHPTLALPLHAGVITQHGNDPVPYVARFPTQPQPPSARLIALSHGPDDGEEDAPGAYQARGLAKQVLRRLRKSEPPMGLR